MTAIIPMVVPVASSGSYGGPNPGAVIFILGVLLLLCSGIAHLLSKVFKDLEEGLQVASALFLTFGIGFVGFVGIISLIELALFIARILGF